MKSVKDSFAFFGRFCTIERRPCEESRVTFIKDKTKR